MADNIKTVFRLLKLYAKMDLSWLLQDWTNAVIVILSETLQNLSGMAGILLLAVRFGGVGGMTVKKGGLPRWLPAVTAVLLWDKMQTVSGFMRLDDVLACFKTWLTAPLFGTGYWNDESVIPFFTYPDRYNNGLSMGVMVVLAQGGLYLLTLYVVPAVRAVVRARGQTHWMLGAFILMMFALLFTSNIAYNFLTLLLIALFMEYGEHKLIEE